MLGIPFSRGAPFEKLPTKKYTMPSSTKKSATKIIGVPWKLSDVWNQTLDIPVDRPFIKRDYCYASEMGTAFCDRYLKMNAVAMSNPPNTRSLRKFQSGHTWEFIMGIVLISAGMLKKKQIRVETNLPRLLRVSGRLDFIVGPPDDWKAAKESIEKLKDSLELLGLDVPPFFFTAIDKFVEKYSGKKLVDVILETKALSSFMMEKVEKTGHPLYHHALQAFHYVYGNDEGINLGKIFYVGKDDCLMQEFDVHNDERLLEIYKNDLRLMTKYYNAGFNPKKPQELMPEKEPLVLFEEGVWKFSKNWNVEYSNYLTFLYGYATPEAYRMGWQYKVSSWNRVFKRCVQGANMTPKNKEAIADALKFFPKWDKLVAKAKAAGAFEKNDDDSDE